MRQPSNPRISRFGIFLFAMVIGVFFGLIISAVTVRADELYLELGVGRDPRLEEGSNPRSIIRLRYEMDNPAWWTPDVIELDHHSSVFDGKPFNRTPEQTVDQFSFVWRFQLLK